MSSGVVELLANPYTPRILEAVLGAALIFFVTISVILLYHWKRYESTNVKIAFVTTIYFTGFVILFGGATYYLFLFIK